MNREIKFRSWDKITKIMFTNPLDARAVGSLSINEYACWENIMKDDNFEVMQYIGLKDKNGKEIYEGDVVSYKNGKYVIAWDTEIAGFQINYGECMYDQEAGVDLRESEIIGNIYENKELVT